MQGVSFQIENLSLLMTNEIRYRGANMGFVLFNQNTNNDDKNIETNFIFAHEVAAGYCGDIIMTKMRIIVEWNGIIFAN